MVSVANPANALTLIRNTYRICQSHQNPSLDILHMVPVPGQLPLSQARDELLHQTADSPGASQLR